MVLRKTVTVSRALNVGGDWNVAFPQVSFTPDEVIVRGVSVLNLTGAAICVNIFSSLINDYMFSFAADASVSSVSQAFDIHHILGRDVNSNTYRFNALAALNGAPVAGNIILSFQLEFVKYSDR